MSLQYLIDGYNLIHSPFFQDSHKKFKDERLALLFFIRSCRLTGSLKNKVTVVFDGYSSELEGEKSRFDIEIVFSGQISADEKIARLIERSPNPKVLCVVSDDRQVCSSSRMQGARCIGLEEFIGPAKKIKQASGRADASVELTHNQMHKINQELRGIWLKE